MRVVLLIFALSFAGLFIQASVVHGTFPSAVAPDVILVLMVLVALRYRTVPGIFGCFALGLLEDFASAQFVGPNAAAGVVVFAAVGFLANRVYAEKSLAVMLITFLCSIASSLSYLLMLVAYLPRYAVQREVIHLVIAEAVLSAVIAPVILKVFLWGKHLPGARVVPGKVAFHWSQPAR